jgi:hypothetical protein
VEVQLSLGQLPDELFHKYHVSSIEH